MTTLDWNKANKKELLKRQLANTEVETPFSTKDYLIDLKERLRNNPLLDDEMRRSELKRMTDYIHRSTESTVKPSPGIPQHVIDNRRRERQKVKRRGRHLRRK